MTTSRKGYGIGHCCHLCRAKLPILHLFYTDIQMFSTSHQQLFWYTLKTKSDHSYTDVNAESSLNSFKFKPVTILHILTVKLNFRSSTRKVEEKRKKGFFKKMYISMWFIFKLSIFFSSVYSPWIFSGVPENTNSTLP